MTPATRFTIEPGKPTVVIQRLFDAPPDLVFAAWTKPENVALWYGFRAAKLSVCTIDLKPGGAWRYVIRMPDGSEHGFGGVYREVVPGRRLVYTFCYDGYPDAEAVETVTFAAERGGKTLLTSTLVHKSVENRDGHVASGMESGATESLDRLAELLAVLATSAASAASQPQTRRSKP